MYGKLVNNALIIAPRKLPSGDNTVYNPPAELYLAQGWLPVEYTESPEAPEDYYYEPGWEQTEDAIVQTWTLTPMPDDIDEAEAFDIIFGGGAE